MDDREPESPRGHQNRPASVAPAQGSFTSELLEEIRAWARHTFSAASLLTGVKSLLWVAPLSVVIWIYAEQSDIHSDPQRTAIALNSADPSREVRTLEPADGKISFNITGSNTNRQKVKETLDALPALALELPQSVLATPGDHEIPASTINDLEVFRSNAVTVSEITPAVFRFHVDKVAEVEVPVQAAPDGANLSAAPVFTPRTVRIRAADAVINAAAAHTLVALAHLDRARETLTPGPLDLTGVPLTLSVPFDGQNVTIVPATVSAHVEIKKSDITLEVKSIPVGVNYAPGADDKFKAINYPTAIPDVTVIGPEEQIRAMQDPAFPRPPYAWFKVGALDAANTDTTQILHFELPTGVRLLNAPPTVTYRLTERRASE